MHRVLHLSDIHFGPEHAFAQDGRPPTARSLSEAVGTALEDSGIPGGFSVLIVSGDVFGTRSAAERTEARRQIAALVERVDAERVLIVPGNHDVDWSAGPEERLYDYARLVDDLRDTGLETIGAPDELPLCFSIEKPPARPLAIVGMNSCILETETQRGLGLVGDQQLDQLARQLRERGITPSTHTVIAVLHHHLLPVATKAPLPPTSDPGESERLIVSLTVDAATVLRRLEEFGVSVVLHGHQHVPALMRFGQASWQHPPMLVAAAGSASALGSDARRQFFVLDISDKTANVHSLAQRDDDPGRFELEAECSAVGELRQS